MDMNNKTQILDYAGKFFNGNHVEALRIATNTCKNYTYCHFDLQNDETGSYSTVLSISRINNNSHKVIVFYSRKCIRESITRSQKAVTYIKEWINFLDGIEESRKK